MLYKLFFKILLRILKFTIVNADLQQKSKVKQAPFCCYIGILQYSS